MTPRATAALRHALRQLEAEGKGIDRQIKAIRSVLGGTGQRRHPRPKPARRRMGAAARRAVSQRMKAYWAKRRAEKALGK